MAEKQNEFSKEDLESIPGDRPADTGGADPADTGEQKSAEDLQAESPAAADDKPAAEAKDVDRKSETAEKPAPKKKVRDTIFDDDDDEPDEVEAKEEGEADKEEKPADKEVKDWRDAFITRALQGKENELTAAKLEKRKDSLRRQLSRYKSAEDYMLAGLAAQEKLRSGEYRRAKLPEDATDEEKANWRKEVGIPEESKAYEIPKIAGHKWTEEDTPFIDSFKEAAFGANMDQEQLNRLTHWYASNLAEQQDQYLEKVANQDRLDMETLEDGLRAELGAADFRPAKNLVQRLLKDKDQGIGAFEKQLREARYPDEDGNYRRLISHPQFTRWLIDQALETYGDASLISGDAKDATNNRMKEIESIRDSDIDTYWRSGLDKEYADLVEKQSAANKRGRRVSV